MWGEFETPAKTQLVLCGDSSKTPVESEEETRSPPGCEQNSYTNLTLALLDLSANRANNTTNKDQQQDQPVSSYVSAMVEAVAQSGSLVKSQQMGEAELTLEQRRGELLLQYRSKPLVFLERYQAHLKPQHLASFSHLRSDPRSQHYCRVIQKRATGHADRTRVRNQRYAALRALQKDGQYFSEEQMRVREPLLYEQYVGQYLSDEEVLERSQAAMQGGAEECTGAGGLAHLLLDSYQERLIQNRLQDEHEREECAQEEDEDEDSGVKDDEWQPTPQDKAQLREEFNSQMHQRFLEGKDKDFNYSEVDENPDYDNLDIVNRDAEEKYFDDDNDEEEEEEEEQEEEEDVHEQEDTSQMEEEKEEQEKQKEDVHEQEDTSQMEEKQKEEKEDVHEQEDTSQMEEEKEEQEKQEDVHEQEDTSQMEEEKQKQEKEKEDVHEQEDTSQMEEDTMME